MNVAQKVVAEGDFLPETVEACDAEIETLEAEVDDIAAQIEVADKGFTHQGDYAEWRPRALAALRGRKRDLHQLYRHKRTLEYEAAASAKQAEHNARQAIERPIGIPKSEEARRNVEAAARASEEAHRRKMERIKAANDKSVRHYQSLRGWLAGNHPAVWQEARAFLDRLEAQGDD